MKQILLPESTVETVAGGFAGICQVLVGHPFDTIKVFYSMKTCFLTYVNIQLSFLSYCFV